ncbi:MAG: WD40 repeat domain-containing protein [Methanoregula sp.]|nr:WD40 repeat domain-containing protein [Methanoregula sp.]
MISLSPDNRFLVSSNPDKTELFVVSTNGTLMWSYVPEKSTGDWSPWISGIAISPDSSRIGISVMVPGCCRGVLTNTTSNKVILFDQQGNMLWNYSNKEPPGTIAISGNGEDIFVGYHTRSLICLDRSGALRWKYPADSPITDIAVSPDGNYLLATGGNVEGQYTNDAYYLAKDGRLIWKRQVRGINNPGISPDGQDLIVSGYPAQNTFSFGTDGKVRWEHSLYSDIGRVLSLDTNGRYVLAGSEDKIQLLDHHGERLWNYSVSAPVYSVSLSENKETIAAGTATGIVVFDGSGNLLKEYRLNQTVCPVMVARDGTSVAALSDRLLFFPVRDGIPDQGLSGNNGVDSNKTADISPGPTAHSQPGFSGFFCITVLMAIVVLIAFRKRRGRV